MRELIFVSDFFADQVLGGAELSLQALIDACPYEHLKINSADVDKDTIVAHKEAFWVIGNFTNLKYSLLPFLSETVKYAVIEFDYKFCKFRNPQMHKFSESLPCDCYKTFGKRIENFYSNAEVVFWMSEAQQGIFFDLLPAIKETRNVVLSSVFSDETLDLIKQLRIESRDKPRRGPWVVSAHDSWVKGFQNTVQYCADHGISPQVITARKHTDLLKTLADAKGLVYMPNGEDTCPRLVIEAKLLGCELMINDFVQHKNEAWFKSDNLEEMDIFLRYRKYLFLISLKKAMGINDHSQEVYI